MVRYFWLFGILNLFRPFSCSQQYYWKNYRMQTKKEINIHIDTENEKYKLRVKEKGGRNKCSLYRRMRMAKVEAMLIFYLALLSYLSDMKNWKCTKVVKHKTTHTNKQTKSHGHRKREIEQPSQRKENSTYMYI